MSIHYTCLGCQHPTSLPEDQAGSLAACSNCGLKFLVPPPRKTPPPTRRFSAPPPKAAPATPTPAPATPTPAPATPAPAPSGGLFGVDDDEVGGGLFGMGEDEGVGELFGGAGSAPEPTEEPTEVAPAGHQPPPGYGYPPPGYPPPGYQSWPPPGYPGYPPPGYYPPPGAQDAPPGGYPPGYPPQEAPPGGYPGYPPQDAPPGGYPGYPPQGYPGYPPPGYPPPGYPPPGHVSYPPPGGVAPGSAPSADAPAHAAPASDPRPPAAEEPLELADDDARGFRLVALDGLADGTVFELGPGELYTMGRDRSAEVKILSTSVSRSQAQIDARGPEPVLIDLGSANGTFVNGEPVERQTLKNGDLIKMGVVLFRYERS